ncbi:MAG: 3-deoxy-D-manno-octulosonic acid transferase [Chitinophagales bacterium]|nr:3-deoxy-D-manno-octulosonic acid transferase [Chitinophagales bacterium]
MLKFFSKIVYSASVKFYHFFIGLASFFNEKAYRFTTGRLNQVINEAAEPSIWFHCASLGEFEQAKPLINWFYQQQQSPIILTFFSPSGYTQKVNFPLARAVYYLPQDGPGAAKDFIRAIQPKLAFFIKYDFWYFHLQELKKRNIPHFLISGIFREEQLFFKAYGVLHREMLSNFSTIFVQDEASLNLLIKHHYSNCLLAHDTRFDTVKSISELNYSNEIIENFIATDKCIILGSSWLKDELLFAQNREYLGAYKLIIAPHDVNYKRITQLRKLFPDACLLSDPQGAYSSKVLIIDSIGKLSSIYRYGTICYVGGGFGVSVHNILEAAVYGKAILFGPNHRKSKEALDLVALKGAFEIRHKEALVETLSLLEDEDLLRNAEQIAKTYVEERTGGTQMIIKQLKSDKLI